MRGDLSEFVSGLKGQPGRAVWLCGGGQVASTLLAAGLIDKVIVKLNPVLFGRGIPLFGEEVAPTALELTESTLFNSGHAVLHYRIRWPRRLR